ncbi:hypothetical protein Btru_019691 [Bulinus truncatus]|nr:hypothetical protein Btru_019691 [Bulinus truncatus]
MYWHIQLIGISTFLQIEAFDNYFQLNSSSVNTDSARGVICFNYNEYIPSCGWTLILSANKNLTGVMADGVNIFRQAGHIFILENTWCNKDLSSKPIDLCLKVTLYGQFNNIKPSVYVGWKYICNATTAGQSQMVQHQTVMLYGSYPSNDTGYLMTKQYAPTLSSVLGLCPNASMSKGASLQFTGYYRYTGQHLVDFPSTFSKTSCCLICLNSPLCFGVNYIVNENLCQVINEFIDFLREIMNWYIQLIGISTLLKVEAFDNYFQLNSSSVSTDRARGVICFDYNEYIPSCGWTLVLSANKNLTGVMADGVIVSRQAPYIFRLQNTWCNKDLSSRPINLCLNVSLYAQFNNVKPAVYVGWQQVCNSSTAGLSKAVPYHYLMPYNSYPSNDTGYLMTKQYAPTLSSVMGLCPNASMSRSASLQFTGYYRYNGQHLVNFPNTLNLVKRRITSMDAMIEAAAIQATIGTHIYVDDVSLSVCPKSESSDPVRDDVTSWFSSLTSLYLSSNEDNVGVDITKKSKCRADEDISAVDVCETKEVLKTDELGRNVDERGSSEDIADRETKDLFNDNTDTKDDVMNDETSGCNCDFDVTSKNVPESNTFNTDNKPVLNTGICENDNSVGSNSDMDGVVTFCCDTGGKITGVANDVNTCCDTGGDITGVDDDVNTCCDTGGEITGVDDDVNTCCDTGGEITGVDDDVNTCCDTGGEITGVANDVNTCCDTGGNITGADDLIRCCCDTGDEITGVDDDVNTCCDTGHEITGVDDDVNTCCDTGDEITGVDDDVNTCCDTGGEITGVDDDVNTCCDTGGEITGVDDDVNTCCDTGGEITGVDDDVNTCCDTGGEIIGVDDDVNTCCDTGGEITGVDDDVNTC